jgi:hypothetical protein
MALWPFHFPQNLIGLGGSGGQLAAKLEHLVCGSEGRKIIEQKVVADAPPPSVKAKNREGPFPGDNKCSQSIELDEGKNEEAFSSVLADEHIFHIP